MKSRFKKMLLTFIAKKYVAWLTAGVFLWFGKINGMEWVLLTGAIFAIDLATKINVAPPTVPPEA